MISTCNHPRCPVTVQSGKYCDRHDRQAVRPLNMPLGGNSVSDDLPSIQPSRSQQSTNGVDFNECDCATPTIGVSVAEQDPWRHQTIYCEACDHEFVTLTDRTGGEAE